MAPSSAFNQRQIEWMKDYLKNNLSIEMEDVIDFGPVRRISVKLLLENEEISKSFPIDFDYNGDY